MQLSGRADLRSLHLRDNHCGKEDKVGRSASGHFCDMPNGPEDVR